MTPFGYLTVLVSLVLALGVTRILTGVGQVVQYRDRVDGSLVHMLWVAALFVFHVQYWWNLYSLRGVPSWTFLGFVVALVPPALLYLMAVVLFPEGIEEGVDLRRYFVEHRTEFFALLPVTVLSGVAVGFAVAPGSAVLDAVSLAVIGGVVALSLVALWTRNPVFHALFALLAGGAVLVSGLFAPGLAGGG